MNPLEFSDLILAAVFALSALGVSRALKLGLEKDFLIASLRTALQLVAIGYVLRWILGGESVWLNLLTLAVMTAAAAQAIGSRLKKKTWKVYVSALSVLIVGVWPLGFLALAVLSRDHSFSAAAVFIPFAGVLLGNSLAAISLTFIGLEKMRNENLLEIETFKALGGSGFESCHRLYREILRQALTPILNGMTVVGLVSLPGVMAGQLLGGVDPVSAARFQILVMFLILMTSLCGALAGVGIYHFYWMPSWLRDHQPKSFFDVPRGSFLGLAGASGAGKTRLLKSLTVIDDPTIHVKMRAGTDLTITSLRNGIVYVHQRPFFEAGTVEENLRRPFEFSTHRLRKYNSKQALKWVEELGMDSNIFGKSALSLSGGEAQVIHLVRALLLDPVVLLLDEPTSAMDPQREKRTEEMLKDWMKSRPQRQIVLVTHDQEQRLRLCKETLEVHENRLRRAVN